MSEDIKRGCYHIGAVSKLTGISTHTIRVWERRYKAVSPRRSAGGTREYSADEVDKLALLRTLSEVGHAIGSIAHLELGELQLLLVSARERGLFEERAQGREKVFVSRTVAAIADLNTAEAERTLLEASSVLSPLAMVLDVIAPLVKIIGERWESGALRIAHEHAASAVLRSLLGTLLSKQSTQAKDATAVVATISGELHELGALMAAFVAVTQGYQLIYMGPNLPAREIAHVVEKKGASLLMLSIVNQRSDKAASSFRALRSALPAGLELLVGGRAASEYSDIFSSEEQISSLQDLCDRLARPPRRVRVGTGRTSGESE